MLLHIALASAPTSGIFHNALLIGRMRASGAEIVVNSIPFASTDRENVSRYAAQVDSAFLPRPQGARPAIAVGSNHAAAFEAFRIILKKTGLNMASTSDYHASLWAAIRAGWREGYTVEADPIVAGSIESAKDAIAQAAGCTKFSTDTSHLFIEEAAWSDSVVEEKFIELFPPEDRRWIEAEFTKQFSTARIQRLAVKFGRSLQLNENLYDAIKQRTRAFDFEPSLAEAGALTTAPELIFYLHWLKARGRPAQLVAPNLGFEDAGERLRELAAVARHFQATLSIHSGSGKQAEVLERIGKATAGRVNYKISGGVLSSDIVWLAERLRG